MATVKWMWGDAALMGRRAARYNPLRWSRSQRLDDAIAELKLWRSGRPELRCRPVRVLLRGPPPPAGPRCAGRCADGASPPAAPPPAAPAALARSTSAGTASTLRSGLCCVEELLFDDLDDAICGLRARGQALTEGTVCGGTAGPGRPGGLGSAGAASITGVAGSAGDEAVAVAQSSPKGGQQADQPFRCEDRAAIPDELLEGPFEDFELSGDVYTTAYLIARNATPDMYSICPWKNAQVRPVWRYLFFIVGSQLFIVFMLTCLYPPAVATRTWYVDCGNATSVAAIASEGVIVEPSPASCVGLGTFAFEADVRGRLARYYRFERSTPFYKAILAEGSCNILLLRLICCMWTFSQTYFNHFSSLEALFQYHDFSRWFLKVKGEELRNAWAICIPLTQYVVLLLVTTVSFMVLCASTEAIDIVMNSLAFTFIAEVGSYFNEPLVKYLAATRIRPAPYGNPDIYYLYPEYKESNAVNPDGTYADAGWYICDDEAGKAGLLTDYKIRHNSGKYDHACEGLILTLRWALILVPGALVLLGALFSESLDGDSGSAVGNGTEL